MLSCALLPVGLLLPSPSVSRRDALKTLPGVFALPALASPAVAAAPSIDEIRILASKAKALRSSVRSSSAGCRKLTKDQCLYSSQLSAMARGKEVVLLPLQKAMAAYASTTTLPDAEMQKQLKLQPRYMKGHLLELDQALAEVKFDEYVSKTTGKTYKGGKVERELEEACETADDFLALAAGRAVPERDGEQ